MHGLRVVASDTIDGVSAVELETHADHRGDFTELFRGTWSLGAPPVQWNLMRSRANTLRGVHAHLRHTDYVTVVQGTGVIGLKDLRRNAPSYLKETTYELVGSAPRLLHIPPGVAHGFYFPSDSVLVFAVSDYFDPEDELGYRWDDPAGLLFPEVRDPLLSPRDAEAPALGEVLARLEPHQESLYA